MQLIKIDREVYSLTAPYINGAKANRIGRSLEKNPHRRGSAEAQQWADGHRNESRLVHVVAGVDLITQGPISNNVIAVAEPASVSTKPHSTYLRYMTALMKCTGLLETVERYLQSGSRLTPASLASHLRDTGRSVGVSFANLILRRLELETNMAGVELSDAELQRALDMTANAKLLVLAIAKIQAEYYDRRVQPRAIAAATKKSIGWPAQMARTMSRDGLGFALAIHPGRQSITLSPKGWTTSRLLLGLRQGHSPSQRAVHCDGLTPIDRVPEEVVDATDLLATASPYCVR